MRRWYPKEGGFRLSISQVRQYRIKFGYRALGILENDVVTWFWIGGHDEYEKFFS